jgi:hypothetical protein
VGIEVEKKKRERERERERERREWTGEEGEKATGEQEARATRR